MDNKVENNRNYGIDLLRFVSMFYVVILHIFNHGGILYNTVDFSSQYKISWFLEIIAYCAVDIFALISGYVGYRENNGRFRLSNYMYLWITVLFYSVGTALLCRLIDPEKISVDYIKRMMFPVTNNLYWYFTQYTILFLLTPFLNGAIKNISKENTKKITTFCFIWFTIIETFTKRFVLNDGYSALWLIALYLLGAIIKKYDIGQNLSFKGIIVYIIALCVISWLWKINNVEFKIMEYIVTGDYFVNYTSPTIFMISVFYLIGFLKIKVTILLRKIVKFITPCVFSIYLIHESPAVRDVLMTDRFKYLISTKAYIIPGIVLISALLISIACILIDKVRMFIFDLLHIKQLTARVDEMIDRWCGVNNSKL